MKKESNQKQINKNKKSKNPSPKKEKPKQVSKPKKLPSKLNSVPKNKEKQNKNKIPNEENKNNIEKNELTNNTNNNNTNNNNTNNNNTNNNNKGSKKDINTKKQAPFSIVFGNKKIPSGNIDINNNGQNQEEIKKKQSNKFSHQSPLRYNRPFQNNNFDLNSKYKNKSNIYSVFIKNYLDSSHLYDLHKANWDVTQPNIPTAKLRKIKLGNPFAVGNKHKTNFGHVYSAGGIPCRIEHGNVNMKLVWSIPPASLEYDPTLIICFEGLLETLHPYSFAAKQCVRELLSAQGAQEKVIPILGRLIPHLKNALVCDNPDTFLEAMNVVEMLSDLVGELMNPYLHFFLQSINKRSFNLKYKERVFDLLRTLEANGGPDALAEIKKKVPTYMSSI